MATTKKISLFWEEKNITILEVEKNQPVQSNLIDLTSVNAESNFSGGLTEEIQIVALIQKALRELRIETADVVLALGNKDVIIRSFVIPALRGSEIQTAVQFEAKKYIPFDLNDLRYTFHTIPFVENNTKRLRVTLYAVRKDVMDKYERIIKQTGLNLVGCEPAVVGLCRTMLYQKDITADSRVAVLDVNENTGSIYFIDQGIAVFIRDFQLNMASIEMQSPLEVADVFRSRVFNEIRHSFDFFNRQHSESINQLLVYSDDSLFDIVNAFADELEVKLRRYTASLNSPAKLLSGIGVISSFGVLIPPVSGGAPVSDLLAKPKAAVESSFKMPTIDIDIQELMPAIKVLVGIVLVLGALFVFLNLQKQNLEKQVQGLTAQQGEFADQTVDFLQTKITNFTTATEEIKKIRIKSDLHVLTVLLLQYVQDGMWLENFDVKYADEKQHMVSVAFRGNVYLADANSQIKAVNDFVNKLRADKEIAKFFGKVQLQSIQRQDKDGVVYTSFSVKCS